MIKKIFLACSVTVIVFLLIDCGMQKVAEQNEGFTQANFWAYYFFTDREIRHAPYATESCHFTFTALEGSQPQESSIVCQSDVSLLNIKNYLTSLGYSEVEHDAWSERWEKKGDDLSYFSVWHDKASHTLTLTKVSFHG